MRALRRGPQVYIRPLAIGDEREFIERANASRSLHRPWSYPPESPAAFRELLDPPDGARSERFVVCRNEDEALAGYFALGHIELGAYRGAYLGYFAFEPFAGHGYMREGLELVLRYAFTELRLHRVQANIQPGNERSIALVRAAGFRKEGFARRYLKIGGRWRDHEQWAITAEDRRARRPA